MIFMFRAHVHTFDITNISITDVSISLSIPFYMGKILEENKLKTNIKYRISVCQEWLK